MHELAIAQSIVELVEEHARRDAFTHVREIRLVIGALSHVDPRALEFGFDVVARGTVAAGARLAAFYCESIISCGGQVRARAAGQGARHGSARQHETHHPRRAVGDPCAPTTPSLLLMLLLLLHGAQVVLPPGYLRDVYEVMHGAGAVCVADEVQCGFGRVGDAGFWAFEAQRVVPDILTFGERAGGGGGRGEGRARVWGGGLGLGGRSCRVLGAAFVWLGAVRAWGAMGGAHQAPQLAPRAAPRPSGKPCGNGYPMSGLVTTPRLADAFSNGMEFFATFAGRWVPTGRVVSTAGERSARGGAGSPTAPAARVRRPAAAAPLAAPPPRAATRPQCAGWRCWR